MKLLHCASSVAVAAVLLTGVSACASSDAAAGESATAAEGLQLEGDPQDQRRRPPPPPPACESNDDCADECPPDAQGCTCGDTPMGQRCIPTCEQDADCPNPPGHELRCAEGVCVPDGPPPPPPPPPPPACESNDDCADKCPPDAQGCTCGDTPMGQRCIPTCEQDADCPNPPGRALRCDEGVCVPDGPPPPPPPSPSER